MLYPTYINWADERLLRKTIKKELKGKILDVGCGRGRLRKIINQGSEYIGIDSQAGKNVDVVGDVHALPFADGLFDGVICTAVLEHVADETVVLREILRVLKKGGKLILTIPFIHHYHRDPEDYRRLSHVGLEKLLEKNGFINIKTYRNNGVFTVVEYAFFCELVNVIKEKLYIRKWYLLPYFGLSFVFFCFFKVLNYLTAPMQKADSSMYVGVLVVARK